MLSQFLASILSFAINGARDRTGTRPSRGKQTPADNAPPPDGVTLGRIVRSPFEALSGPDAGPTDLVVSDAMLLRHLSLLGGTGTGKTNLLLQVVRSLIARRSAAVCILDPRGDLVDRVLTILAHDYAPDDLRERVVLIDLRRDDFSVPFNVLREPGLDPYTRVALLLDVIGAQWELGVQTAQPCGPAC